MDVKEIKDNVATTIKQKLSAIIAEYEDNLAISMQGEVKDYNPDWCSDSADSHEVFIHDELVETALNRLVNAELKVLFANCETEE